ncbi:MAG: extracellular solute-binding protein [Nonomuraea sp.]|nr:extracellular solute-binding protein [Nonomuraea sp.]
MRGAAHIIAAAGLALALTACGDSGGVGGRPAASQAPQQSGGSVTLKYWTWFPPEATLKATITAFEQANPGIKVELREFEAADYQKQLPLALNGGEALDVVGVQISALTNTVKDQLRPVSEWEAGLGAGWRDRLDPTMVAQTEKIAKDGTLYSVPMGSIGSAIMYSNAAMLKELGADFPKTVDDLAAIAKKVRPGVQPVVFSGEPYWQEEMLFTISGQTSPTLSDDVFAKRKPWNAPELVGALGDYRSLFERGVVDRSVLSLKGARPAELFGSGKALFLVDGSWQSTMLSAAYRKDNKLALTDVGAGPFPVVRQGGKPAARGLAEGGLAIPKSSTHADQAAKLIRFMTLGDGVKTWSKDLVLVPSLKGFQVDSSVLTTDAAASGYRAVQDVISAGGSARDSNQAFLNQVEGNAILDVLRGQATPQQAADRLQKEFSSGRYDTK